MTALCPTCRQMIEGPAPIDAMCRQLTPTMAEIVRALAGKGRRTAEELADAVYAGVPVEPADCPGAIKSVIAKQRGKLAPYGWRIDSQRGGHGGYSLMKIREAEERSSAPQHGANS